MSFLSHTFPLNDKHISNRTPSLYSPTTYTGLNTKSNLVLCFAPGLTPTQSSKNPIYDKQSYCPILINTHTPFIQECTPS